MRLLSVLSAKARPSPLLCSPARQDSMKLAAVLALWTAVVVAQTPQTFEIRGKVVEMGAGIIPEADIEMTTFDEPSKTIRTDVSGAFRIAVTRPGLYSLIARKDGYFPPSTQGAISMVMVNAGQTIVETTLSLERSVQITGRVLDAETRQPISGIDVHLFRWVLQGGRTAMTRINTQRPLTTDSDGHFQFSGMPPGDYLAALRASSSTQTVVAKFSTEDTSTQDRAFDFTFWPGGRDAAAALPVHIASGGYGEIGTILARRHTEYRVRAKLSGACQENETVRLHILKRDAGRVAAPIGKVSCNADILLRGFEPGSYTLYAISDHQGGREDMDDAVWGVWTFDVKDKNVESDILLQRVIVIEGQLTLAEGAATPRVTPRISTRPIDLIAGAEPPDETFLLWREDRKFHLALAPRTQRLTVTPFSDGPIVKEIRYNGSPIRDGILNPTGGPAKLEIVMGAKEP